MRVLRLFDGWLMLSFLVPLLPLLLLLPPPSEAQPWPEILWWTDLDAPSFGSAACADIDEDGKLEIVFGTYFNDESIHALNGEDGSELWSFFTDGCNDASPVIYDVDLDGQLEVIVPASSPQMVYCLDGDSGTVEWSYNTGHCIDSPPSIGDVDGDDLPEVVVGTFNGYVYCLNGEDGGFVWECSLGTNSYIQSCPNLLDLDGDQDLDVVVAQWQGDTRVYGLDGSDGTEIWHSDAPQDWMYHGGSFADVDEDGLDEIAIGSYDSNIYLLNSEDGSTEWEYATAAAYVGGPTSIADLNLDGHLEVVFAANTTIGALTWEGDPLWLYTASGGCFRGAAISNINGDTTPDVIFGTSAGHLVALTGTLGEEIWNLDLQAHYGQTFDIDHAPTVADFDGDGKLDVFVVGGYGTSSSPQDNHGRAYLVGAGDGTGAGWLTFRHDELRSACFDTTATGIEGGDPPETFQAGVTLAAAPNPFSSAVGILVLLEVPATSLQVTVYDTSGRVVERLHSGPAAAGSLILSWSASGPGSADLPSGTYIVRARAGESTATRKVMLLR